MSAKRTDFDHYGIFTSHHGTVHLIRFGDNEIQLSLSPKGHKLRVFVGQRELK